ncbi:MAG: hypothetical protein HDR88_06765 [Bacteroides sp.]|nr:hypothetical protein [Bacteroides sp.]
MAQFINPFTDTGFKIIFGKEDVSNDILISFLKVLFADDPVLSKINSVQYRQSERTREWEDGKSIVYDVHCVTSTGHRFILEMQVNEQEFFLKRAFYYLCRCIAEQGYKGKLSLEERRKKGLETHSDLTSYSNEDSIYWDYNFIPVVGVFFSSFFIDGLEPKLVTSSQNMDIHTFTPVGDYLRAVFIQLPAFTKTKQECETLFDQWIYNLKHMSSMESMAFTSHQDIFKRLANIANLATLSPQDREQYEYDLKKARDYHAEMNFARKKAMNEGRAEGRAEGIAEGIAQEKINNAINLKKMGVPVHTISQALNLSEDEIANL